MIAAVVRSILVGLDTLDTCTLVTTMASLVQITIRLIKCVITIIVDINFSIFITLKESTSFLIEIRLDIRIIEYFSEHLDVGRDWIQLCPLRLEEELRVAMVCHW